MFKYCDAAPVTRVVAARAARVAFGAMLIAGAVTVAHGAVTEHRPFGLHQAAWFGVVWASALAAGLAAWLGGHALRIGRDPDQLAGSGLAVPAVGLALLGPLSIHLLLVPWLGTLRDFDQWVIASLIITGTAHLALAVMSGIRAYQLARGDTALTVRTIYGVVVLVSCIPFVVLYLIPPILVALTGLAFLPVLQAPVWIAARERALLAGAPPLARVLAA